MCQFGFYGAIFIFLASILLDVGYLAAQQVVQAQSLQGLIGSVSIPVWIIVVTIPAVLLAVFGYHWIHRIQPFLTVLFGGALVAAVILTATSGGSLAKGMGGTRLSSFPIFIAAVGLFFMNMLSLAVYVSDYSRYLPKNVSGPRTFWAVFGGSALGTCLYGGLGIYITAVAPSHGGLRWAALIPYVIALAAQVPFLDQTLYTGPMVKVLGGADISWIVGWVMAGTAYLVSSRLAGSGAGARAAAQV